MKLVTFVYNGHSRIGVLVGDGSIVDLNRANPILPTDMLAFLAGGADTKDLAEKAVSSSQPSSVLVRSAVTLEAPFRVPEKFFASASTIGITRPRPISPFPNTR